jgi:hypothetical protein
VAGFNNRVFLLIKIEIPPFDFKIIIFLIFKKERIWIPHHTINNYKRALHTERAERIGFSQIFLIIKSKKELIGQYVK